MDRGVYFMKFLHTIALPKHIQEYVAKHATLVYKDKQELTIENVKDAVMIIGNIPRKWLAHCQSLQVLQLESAGSDAYLEVVPQDTILCNASGTFGESISEHLIMVTLMLMRNMPYYNKCQQEKVYVPLQQVRHIKGSTFVVVGTGDLGATYAKKIQMLGGYTIGVKRRQVSSIDGFDEVHSVSSLDTLLPKADVLCLCVPKNADSNALIDTRRLTLLSKHALVLNVGRGNTIEEDALQERLQNGLLGGAALDVFTSEPLEKSSKLWNTNNMIITPHVSGTFANKDTYTLFYEIVLDNLQRFFTQKHLRNIVDKKTG